ncbi:MAG TPA: anion permease, partial [Tepidisphaeraceae bacterium]|nr:anion permease [Tepidisphaeraceae bacterium]
MLALVGFFLPYVVQVPNLSVAGHRMLGIFFAAIVLWITEAVPMHATAVLIILLMIMLLGQDAPKFMTSALPKSFKLLTAKEIFATLSDPTIMK